mmetsp:Transcript_18777/g.56349  ORF Transcript_18777/g.56349 Transcript_18777/m.56349 type:complete len:295 (+) Transcript_18777:158-1042(+)
MCRRRARRRDASRLEGAGRDAEAGRVLLHVGESRRLVGGERLDEEGDEPWRVRPDVLAGALHQLEQLLGAHGAHLLGGEQHAVEQNWQRDLEHRLRVGGQSAAAVGETDASRRHRAPRRLRRLADGLLDVVEHAEQRGEQAGERGRQLRQRAAGQELGEREARRLAPAPEAVAERSAEVLEDGLEVLGERRLRVGHEGRPELAHGVRHPRVWVEGVAEERRQQRRQVRLERIARLLSEGKGDPLAGVPHRRRSRTLHELVDKSGLADGRRYLGELLVGGHLTARSGGVGGARAL